MLTTAISSSVREAHGHHVGRLTKCKVIESVYFKRSDPVCQNSDCFHILGQGKEGPNPTGVQSFQSSGCGSCQIVSMFLLIEETTLTVSIHFSMCVHFYKVYLEKVNSLGIVAHTWTLPLQKPRKQNYWEFKANLGYLVGSRPTWDAEFKQNKQRERGKERKKDTDLWNPQRRYRTQTCGTLCCPRVRTGLWDPSTHRMPGEHSS